MKILTKQDFLQELKIFVERLAEKISQNDEWTMRGVIDILKKFILCHLIQKSFQKSWNYTCSRISLTSPNL